jgi:RimJ/RimL family protein N-acetyltransferase
MFSIDLGDGAELRPLEPWRAEEFLAHMDRARDHIKPWVGASFIAHDLDGARVVLQRYADSRARDAGGIWGIWDGGQLVGGVLLVSFDAASGTCEAGCWLQPGSEGKGLVTRAATVLLDWVFGERKMSRVEWHTNAENQRSIAVAQRLGMSLDGTLREVFPGPSGRVDLQVWSVLSAEWKGR